MLVSSHTTTMCCGLKISAPSQSPRHLSSNTHKYLLESINFTNILNKTKTNYEQHEFIGVPEKVSRHFGPRTLRTQDISAPSDWCRSVRAPVPKCLSDTRALVSNCLDLDHTFLVYVNFYIYNMTHLLLSSGVCV